MNEESAFTQPPPSTPKPSNRRKLIIVFIIVLVLLVIGLVALYIIGGTIKRPTPAPLPPTPTALPTLIPTVTPSASTSATLTATPSASPTSSRGTITVSIQNGSGTPGVAQKYATTLKTAGYTKITTGNADNFEYKGVTVHVTKKYKEYLAILEKDVTKADAKAKVSGSVDDTIKTNAEVIVGK